MCVSGPGPECFWNCSETWERIVGEERKEGLEKNKGILPGRKCSVVTFVSIFESIFFHTQPHRGVACFRDQRKSPIPNRVEQGKTKEDGLTHTHNGRLRPIVRVVYTPATIYKQEIIPTPNGPCPEWTAYTLSFINLSPRCQQPRAPAIRFHLPPVRIVAAMFADYFWRFLVGWMVFGLSEARLPTRLDRWLGKQGKKTAVMLSLKRFVCLVLLWSPLFLCWISRAEALK